MHIEEAIWIKNILKAIPETSLSPVLNLGSSTRSYRLERQPFIEKEIFKPLRERGIKVFHSDIKSSDGVDLVGDILNENFRKKIKSLKIRTIICSNLLEHIEKREDYWKAMLDLLSDGCILLVTVPFKYPKHMDPIDTLYRPSPKELINNFGPSEIIGAQVLSVGKPITGFLKQPGTLLISLVRLMLPFYKYRGWLTVLHKLLHALKMREVSCVALKKI